MTTTDPRTVITTAIHAAGVLGEALAELEAMAASPEPGLQQRAVADTRTWLQGWAAGYEAGRTAAANAAMENRRPRPWLDRPFELPLAEDQPEGVAATEG